ncbi:hypothetical protein BDZ94DRAFT_1248026 [Collybia nuda]|uniref:Uncharacterized protein n=1 Tax=Collybia nuda TaxID=64659 RepID=A0A9P5YFF0_9AGAR|nr:hypothetical protein BDZ94DRAFT_1248026 [Collybia nuda]
MTMLFGVSYTRIAVQIVIFWGSCENPYMCRQCLGVRIGGLLMEPYSHVNICLTCNWAFDLLTVFMDSTLRIVGSI